MGAVWRAEDVKGGTWCAIKVLRPEFARDPAAVARFVRERNALLALRHPNVVTLHDMIVEGERLALVMELVTEGDLEGLRRDYGGMLPPGMATDLVAQVCDGLAAAHAAGIVHRDLKPGNVLMEAGSARLTDFGIARIGGEASVTTAGTILGTVCYMAPETLTGAAPAPACDVYAVGVTLHQLLAGRQPFTGHAATIIYDHLHTAPSRPDGVPDRLWQLISACLAKDPVTRPTAAQLAAALRHPEIVSHAAPTQPARSWLREPTEVVALNAGPPTVTGKRPASGGVAEPAVAALGAGALRAGAPGPAAPREAGALRKRNVSGKWRRTWVIAAAALTAASVGAGAIAAYGRGTAPAVAGRVSPGGTGRSLSPAASLRASTPPTRPGGNQHPSAPPASAAPASPSDPPSNRTHPTGTASTTPRPTPSPTPTSAAPSPTTSTLDGTTVTNLQVNHVYPATNGSNGAVQISWDQVPSATVYTVYMLAKGSFSTHRTLANEGDLPPGRHEIMVIPEPGGKGKSVSFIIPQE